MAALAYAASVGDRRDGDGAPFILHPLEVGGLLYSTAAPDHVIAAGFLHDTIAKVGTAASDLETRFGSPVAELVLALTEDQRIIDYVERKAALCEQVALAGCEALTVFAADKISKVRELSLVIKRTGPGGICNQRLTHYRHCARLLEQRLPHSPLVRRLRAELDTAICDASGPSIRVDFVSVSS